MILNHGLRARRFQATNLVKNHGDSRIRLRAESAFVGLDRHADGARGRILLDGEQAGIVVIPRRRVEVQNILDLAQCLMDDAVEMVCLLVAYSLRLVAYPIFCNLGNWELRRLPMSVR